MSTKIAVEIFGYVPREFIDRVVSTISDFYRAAGGPPVVDLWVYSSAAEKRAVMEAEALKAGVSVVGDFVVSHEAWRGVPRIHVCYESLRELSPDVARALLIHEAAHSTLHGTAAHYVAAASAKAMEKLGLRKAAEAAYMLSTAVKDYEVAELLLSKGFRSELLTYIEFALGQRADLGSDFLNTLQLIKVLAPVAALRGSEPELFTGHSKRLEEQRPRTPVGMVAKLVERAAKLEADISGKVAALLDWLLDEGLLA